VNSTPSLQFVLSVLAWVVPLAVSALNLVLTARLTALEQRVMDKVFEQFEPRESCALKHVAIDAAIARLEKAAASR
jgi:hypothetical protein